MKSAICDRWVQCVVIHNQHSVLAHYGCVHANEAAECIQDDRTARYAVARRVQRSE